MRDRLLKMLHLRLIPRLTPISAMQYLPDLTACIVRCCNHAAPEIVKQTCFCATVRPVRVGLSALSVFRSKSLHGGLLWALDGPA